MFGSRWKPGPCIPMCWFPQVEGGTGRRAELALSKIKTPCSQAGDLAWIPAGCGGILIYHTVAGQGASNTLHSVQLFNHSERVSWPFPTQESHREALFRGSKGGEDHRGAYLVRALASSCFFEQVEEEEMEGAFCWSFQLGPNSLSPNPTLSEKRPKVQLCTPYCRGTPPTPPQKLLTAQDPTDCNFGHQQPVKNASSPRACRVFRTPPSDRSCVFSPVSFPPPHLWVGAEECFVHPGVLCPDKPGSLLFNLS